MNRVNKIFVLTLMGLMLKHTVIRAQDPNWNIDVIGGAPTVLSNVNSSTSPFGGVGLRYTINPLLSAEVQVNGGVVTGKGELVNSLYSNNFLQYSLRGMVNLLGFTKKPAVLSRLNLYLYGGAGYIKCYKRQNSVNGQPDGRVGGYNDLFYVPNGGINIRYYMNENLDLVLGSEMNFTETHILDNTPGGSYDKLMLNYVGISFKLLNGAKKKQSADWSSVKLPYEKYETAMLIAQEKAAESAAKEEEMRKESARVKADADARLAQAEGLQKEMNMVFGKLDTLKNMISAIGYMNNIAPSNAPAQNPYPGNVSPSKDKTAPANAPVASFASFTSNVVPATVVSSNYEMAAAHNNGKSLNRGNEPSAGMVKPIDLNQKYAIVLGSFVKPENAFNAKKQLLEKGYEVDIVHFDDPKVQRLIIYSASMEEAQNRLSEIREKENAEAWMLTIR